MRILLDTCMVLWWMNDSPELMSSEREVISDPENDIYVSVASAWEVEIKRKLGKLDLPDEWKDAVSDTGFRWLNVLPHHTEGLRTLPDIHRDPFDRMIVAEAKSESMTVLTHDLKVLAYFR